jgi:hypothetical protein
VIDTKLNKLSLRVSNTTTAVITRHHQLLSTPQSPTLLQLNIITHHCHRPTKKVPPYHTYLSKMSSSSSNNPFVRGGNPQSSTSSAQDHTHKYKSPSSSALQSSDKSHSNTYRQIGGNSNVSGSSAGQSGSGDRDRPKYSVWERAAERLGGHGGEPRTAQPRQYLPDYLKEDYEKPYWKGGK